MIKNMKKYFVLIITLFGLFLSKSLFISNCVSVSFNQNTTQPIEYQVFWTDDNHEKFSEHAQKKLTTKNNQTNVYIRIPNKKIKNFRLDTGIEPGVVEISDLKINGKSLDLNNFNKSADVESFVVKNGKMIITSNKHDPYIVYKDIINANGSLSINYPIFIILLCFWLALSWVLVSFVSNKNNKTDAIFVLLFGILICIPMLHISNAEKSEQENRMLAKSPDLFVDDDINNKYGTQFNDWFNDRFFGRNLAMNIDTTTKYAFLSNKYCMKNNCLINKDFIKNFDRENPKRNIPDIEEIQKDKHALINLSNFCRDNKIKCYFLSVPERELFLPDADTLPQPYFTYSSVLSDNLKDNKNSVFLDITSQLLSANKAEPVFFKTDHHWTDYGAWIGYKAVADRLKQDAKITLSTDESFYRISRNKMVRAEYQREYTYGSLCQQMNMSWTCPLSYEYKYFDLPNGTKIMRNNSPKELFAKYTNPDGNYGDIIIIGNSMTENIVQFFAHDFKHVYKYRANNYDGKDLNMSRWEKDILKIKPRVLLFVIDSSFLNHLKNMWGK